MFYIFFLLGCSPVTISNLQSAKLLKKYHSEITPSYTISPHAKYYGIQGAYGLTNNINFRMRFEKILINAHLFNENINLKLKENFTQLSLGLKLKLINDKMAFFLPITYTFNNEHNFTYLEPTVIFSYTHNKYEINPSLKYFLNNKNIPIDAFNLGVGFSNNLNDWVIRTELGCMGLITTNFKECFPQFSIGSSVDLGFIMDIFN